MFPDQPVLELENGKEMKCRVVVGADGARSRVASALDLPSPTFVGYSAIRYVQFLVPHLGHEFRGISNLESVEIPRRTILYYLAPGQRFGMYQVEEDKIYWFVAFNTSEVCVYFLHTFDDIICRIFRFQRKRWCSEKQRNCLLILVLTCRNVSRVRFLIVFLFRDLLIGTFSQLCSGFI